MKSEFSSQTLEYLKETDLSYRKKFGQYFTPRTIRDELLNHIPIKRTRLKILDPACGTGEFLLSASEHFPSAELEGWDIDPKLAKIAQDLSPKSLILTKDSLAEIPAAKYDLVIGNPPYYEFTPDKDVKKKFGNVLSGRTNIFSLFIKLGLDLLKDGGYLAYVVPPSMNNGAYFARLREYIVKNSNIEFLKILDDTSLFNDALQMTMLLILRKGINKGAHVFKHNGILIFSEDVKYLNSSFRGTVSLLELGFSVRTGRLIWNQNKERLTDKSDEGIPLLWAHNISETGLRFPVICKKPQYVKVKTYDEGPAIIVNRITGAAKSAVIRAAIVPPKMRFIAENHCNVIFPPKEESQFSIEYNAEFLQKGKIGLEELCSQLRSPEKLGVMQNVTGNTQISKTELERLFPVTLQ